MIVPEKLENRARVRGAIHANFWDQSVQVRGNVYHISPAVHYAPENVIVARCSNICWSCAALMESLPEAVGGGNSRCVLYCLQMHMSSTKRD